MNGAEKLIKAMKKVNESNKSPSSELVYATVIATEPLTFQLSNRLALTSEFYTLSNIEIWNKLQVGDVVKAFSFNDGQQYYIQEKVEDKNYSVASINEKLNGVVEGTVSIKYKSSTGSTITINEALNEISKSISNIDKTINKLQVYSTDETAIGTWIDGKTIYRKVIVDSNAIGTTTSMSRTYSITGATQLIKSYVSISPGIPLPTSGPTLGTTDVVKFDYINEGIYNLTINKYHSGTYSDRTLIIIIEYIK